MNCPYCHSEILPNSPSCIDCGRELPPHVIERDIREKEERKSYSITDMTDLLKLALFSVIFPGLAQIVLLKEFFRGLVFAAGFAASLFMAHSYFGTYSIDMPFLGAAAAIYFYSIINALSIYRAKYQINSSRNSRESIFLVSLLTISMMMFVLYSIFNIYESRYNNIIRVSDSMLSPTLELEDRILIRNLGADEPIKRGNIILFNSGRFFRRGNTADLIAGGNSLERVIALPGEKVRFADGDVFINEKKLDRKFYPLSNIGASAFIEKVEFTLDNSSYLTGANGRYGTRAFFELVNIRRENIVGIAAKITYPFSRRRQLE